MFDIGWSELMILGIVALIVVGPKDLPILLRTIGRYTGMLKKQASEFRHQFDEAMREAELDQLKKDVTGFKDDIESTVRDTTRSVTDELDGAKRVFEIPELDDDPDAHDANGIPIARPKPASSTGGVAADVVTAPAAMRSPDVGAGDPRTEPAHAASSSERADAAKSGA